MMLACQNTQVSTRALRVVAVERVFVSASKISLSAGLEGVAVIVAELAVAGSIEDLTVASPRLGIVTSVD